MKFGANRIEDENENEDENEDENDNEDDIPAKSISSAQYTQFPAIGTFEPDTRHL